LSDRIAYLVQGLGTGGLERVVLHLATEMVRRGHEVTICCYDKRGNLADEAEQAGARVEVLLRKGGVDVGYASRLARWLRRHRPDVLHMHNETALFYGTLAGRLARVPRLSHEKGVDVLIEAFARVREHVPEAELVLVGDGAERQTLEKRATELGLADHIRFFGMRDDVAQLLIDFDLFVLPSRTEGLPLTVLEAMAAGLPIVATAVGGVPQALRHGKTGVLVPPEEPEALAQAIVRLAANGQHMAHLGDAARKEYEAHYAISRMVNAYEAIMGR